MRRSRVRHAPALVCLTLLPACSRPPHPTAAPPPARRAECAGAVRLEGVFALTHGDPPGAAGGPRVSYTIATADGATIVLLIADELLGPHDAGRALHGRRVELAGDEVGSVPRTVRVCAIDPL